MHGLVVFFLSFAGLACLIGMLITGIREQHKTNWLLSLATSIIAIALPLSLWHDDIRAITDVYALLLQPYAARLIVEVTFLTMLLGGFVGLIACIVTAAKWHLNNRREQAAREKREKTLSSRRVRTHMSLYGKNKKI